ncbi:hypothetical protein IWZ03DRAFT_361534 [Phyllosticta citriasiana]|uniref:Uncharacterized protein n=1 Tax=Phyllosticta citriasiana TaxID=595635 RepID=A0ABR1KEX0_9PEZI
MAVVSQNGAAWAVRFFCRAGLIPSWHLAGPSNALPPPVMSTTSAGWLIPQDRFNQPGQYQTKATGSLRHGVEAMEYTPPSRTADHTQQKNPYGWSSTLKALCGCGGRA